jgi:N-acetylglucosamine kinase-like BadF-type ATPase
MEAIVSTLLAVDAGQGGTRARLLADDGRVLSHGEAGGVRHLGTVGGPASTAAVVAEASHIALRDGPPPRTAVVAISGWTDDPSRRGELMARLMAALPGTQLWLTSDAVAAFFSVPPEGPRVSLVVGTGSVAAAADGSGAWALVDGVGHLLGDDGSGFWLGRRGLADALAAADGRGGSDALLALATQRFGDAAGIPERVYGDPSPAACVASFAVDVLAAAADRDPTAAAIVDEAGALLARTADAAASRVFGDGPVSVVLTGGLMARPGPLVDALMRAIEQRRPGTRVVRATQRPLDGAVFLARDPECLRQWFPGLYSEARA